MGVQRGTPSQLLPDQSGGQVGKGAGEGVRAKRPLVAFTRAPASVLSAPQLMCGLQQIISLL